LPLAEGRLGTAANLRPLARTATALAHSVRGWKDVEGGLSIGPLSPCAPIRSRTVELARFATGLLGPNDESVLYSAVKIRTAGEFAATVARYPASPRCDLAHFRKELRESHSTATVAAGRMPKSIAHLSPEVRASRQIYKFAGTTWNRDSISIFDTATRTQSEIFIRAPVGKFPLSLEIRATKAVLDAVRRDG
jgi:hypothetical protein